MLSLLPLLGPASQEGTQCSRNRGEAGTRPLAPEFKSPVLPTVSLAVVLGAGRVVRGGSWPSPQRPPGPAASGRRVSRGGRGTG